MFEDIKTRKFLFWQRVVPYAFVLVFFRLSRRPAVNVNTRTASAYVRQEFLNR
jgi:hypothetical protein